MQLTTAMKKLLLARPIIFIDLETTGLNQSTDRIVEVALLKLYPEGKDELLSTLINPEMPIPCEATAIHGITNEDVAGKDTFTQLAEKLKEFISNCDVAGFNIKRFDLPFLETEFRRAGVPFSRKNRALIDTQVIYHLFEKRDLASAYQKYCGKKLDDNHRAERDVRACVEILDAQIGIYEDLPSNVQDLHEFCCAPDESEWVDTSGRFVSIEGEIIFNFGKHKGKRLNDIAKSDPDYLNWVLHKSGFSLEVQEIVLKALDI